MTRDEALKLAIDALKNAFYEKADEAKKALAEPEWNELTRGDILSWELSDLCFSSKVEFVWFVERKIREKNEFLPQRTWVGLTNDELTDLFYNENLGQMSAVGQAIELLRERNT